MIEKLQSEHDFTYLIHNMFQNINDKVVNILQLVQNLSYDKQIQFNRAIGTEINPYVWQFSKATTATDDLSIPDLISVNRSETFDKLDARLRGLFEAMTDKTNKHYHLNVTESLAILII